MLSSFQSLTKNFEIGNHVGNLSALTHIWIKDINFYEITALVFHLKRILHRSSSDVHCLGLVHGKMN